MAAVVRKWSLYDFHLVTKLVIGNSVGPLHCRRREEEGHDGTETIYLSWEDVVVPGSSRDQHSLTDYTQISIL